MRWGAPDGTPLRDLPIPKGRMWYSSPRYVDAMVAFKMGKFQSEFDAASPYDKAHAIKVFETEMLKEAWEAEVAKEEQERRQR